MNAGSGNKVRCRVRIKAADGTNPKLLQKLLSASEGSCVNLRTLGSGVQVETIVQKA
jgi:hypothetical protein